MLGSDSAVRRRSAEIRAAIRFGRRGANSGAWVTANDADLVRALEALPSTYAAYRAMSPAARAAFDPGSLVR